MPVISGTPSTFNINTDSGMATATTATWSTPTASDNSGEDVTVTEDYTSGHAFPIGTTTVTITATDAYGNAATDTFDVVVTGKMIIRYGGTHIIFSKAR